MSKSNRARKVIAQRAKVQARAIIETQGDKFLARTTYAERRASCVEAYEAHKAAQVMVEGGIIARHW
jgi:galactokinase